MSDAVWLRGRVVELLLIQLAHDTTGGRGGVGGCGSGPGDWGSDVVAWRVGMF